MPHRFPRLEVLTCHSRPVTPFDYSVGRSITLTSITTAETPQTSKTLFPHACTEYYVVHS